MNKFLQISLGLGVLMAIALSIATYSNSPKIAFVDFKRLVTEYKGMKDATRDYESKMKDWNKISDSISDEVKIALSDYYADSAVMSSDEIRASESKIIRLRNKYVEYAQGLDAAAVEEDQKMTVEVVNQVLRFVEKYGDENAYDGIIGRNEGNDVLYKSVDFDITDELLKELNLNYNGL